VKLGTAILCGAIAIAMIAPSFADQTAPAPAPKAAASATALAPGAAAAPAPAAKSGDDIVYPYTFHCSHCGMLITVHNPTEWKKDCEMCACGMKNSDCKPKNKK
jgi:hypothetical protein